MPVRKKILAIDDDAAMREFYDNGLDMVGYEVISVSGAEKAREFLESVKPDLILMDIMMPDLDGISLTREFRSDPKTSDIPILVVSGLDDAATLGDALLFGAADYVCKPVELEDLKVKIEHTFALAERRKKKAAA